MSFPCSRECDVPDGTVYLLGVRYKPIVLAPGQSIYDIPMRERLERGIDWEATAKASAVVHNIGDNN